MGTNSSCHMCDMKCADSSSDACVFADSGYCVGLPGGSDTVESSYLASDQTNNLAKSAAADRTWYPGTNDYFIALSLPSAKCSTTASNSTRRLSSGAKHTLATRVLAMGATEAAVDVTTLKANIAADRKTISDGNGKLIADMKDFLAGTKALPSYNGAGKPAGVVAGGTAVSYATVKRAAAGAGNDAATVAADASFTTLITAADTALEEGPTTPVPSGTTSGAVTQ